MICATHIT